MLRHIKLSHLLVLAAIVTIALATGGAWQFSEDIEALARALAPAWIGIALVYWVLWRQITPATPDTPNGLPPRPLTTDFAPLKLDMRYADIASLPLNRLEIVVVDTETTGLNTRKDNLIQVGAVRIVDGELIKGDSFERLANPGRPIPANTQRFHGITDEMVAHAPAGGEILQEFLDYAGNAVLVGYNIAFDLAFMNRIGEIRNPTLDTMLLSVGAFPSRQDHSLEALADHFNEEIHSRHTALGDADATARIFLHLIPELDRAGARTFGDAQDLCAHSADRIRSLGPCG
ncbi:MAG: 3'-5' exonuclease [Pseudomonadota bacterium]|nr:3'-5' exonuclease [Pseudomonadota bacterium]